jgi:hypothetical protein
LKRAKKSENPVQSFWFNPTLGGGWPLLFTIQMFFMLARCDIFLSGMHRREGRKLPRQTFQGGSWQQKIGRMNFPQGNPPN